MVPFIEFSDHVYSLDSIDDFHPSSPFEANAVQFIKSWLSGKMSFELQTSGSTGTPKVIHVTRQQMEASARFTIEALGLQRGQVALVCLDTDYIAGKMMLVRALMARMNIILKTPEANPLKEVNLQPDFTALVPLQLEQVLNDDSSREILNNMQAVLIGGAPIGKSLRKKAEALSVPVYATYGMTETVSHIALKELNGADRSDIFKAFDEVKLGLDHRGCLTIQSALTNNTRVITNDKVVLHDTHRFEWLGRIDNIINSGGIKVQCERVETVVEAIFLELGITNRCFIAGVRDEKLGEKVILVVEATEPLSEAPAIMGMLQQQLSRYEVPKELMYVPEFMETPTGKVNRKETIRACGL